MGERFGNYEIIRKLATGGMAEVFLAKQTSLGGFERLVCIKRILAHLGEQEDFVKMFQDEARIAANLIHPNIAQIYDIGEVDDAYYIAMEYVRGEDLRHVYNKEVARGRAMPAEPAAHVIMGAAAGLDYAHKQASIDGRPLGIVHRDISPQNLLVTYDGHVKIVDFGVAKAAGKMAETRAGVLKGKYSYMSPEQASGDPIDNRTDVFALGITLYEVTTGVRLFKRDTELETLHAVIESKVTPPTEIIPGYDSALQDIVLKLLARDPDDRYQTAGEAGHDIEKFLVSRSFVPTSATLENYMHELFAEKLADELLFGGPVWEESNTSDNRKSTPRKQKTTPRSKHKRDGNGGRLTEQPTEAAGPMHKNQGEETQIEDDPHSSSWVPARRHKRNRDDWGEASASVSKTATHDPISPAPNPPHVSSVMARSPTIEPSPSGGRWFPAVALGALLLGLGVTVGLVMSSSRLNPRHAQRTGPLEIDSEPRGARVELVGKGVEPINGRYNRTRTPFTITEGLPANVPLSARFAREGYESVEVHVPAVEAGITPEPLFVQLTPSRAVSGSPATLIVLSTPKGAQVWIDGDQIPGETPLTNVQVVGAQTHKIEYRLRGYQQRVVSYYVEPGARRFVDEQLVPERPGTPQALPSSPDAASAPKGNSPAGTGPGFLSVSAAVPLKVSIPGRQLGQTPLRKVSLDAGTYRVSLENEEKGINLHRRVQIEAGQTEVIDIHVVKGDLSVNAIPWATVQVGKTSKVETPAQIALYEGEYEVVFECPNGQKKQEKAKVTAGQTTSLSVNCRQ